MCKLLQMATMVFNNIVTCFDDHNFFFTSFILFLLQHYFFPPKSFFQSHTLFFPNHSRSYLNSHECQLFLSCSWFFLSSSPSCFSNHVIDSFLSAQNFFPDLVHSWPCFPNPIDFHLQHLLLFFIFMHPCGYIVSDVWMLWCSCSPYSFKL
jgi:hypothetical protein